MYIYTPMSAMGLFKSIASGRELEIVRTVEHDKYGDDMYDVVEVKTAVKEQGPEKKFRCMRGELMHIDD